MKKACEEARDNLALVVCFVRANVDTEWWGRYAARAMEIRFPKERMTDAGAETAALFPVAIVIFRPRLSQGCKMGILAHSNWRKWMASVKIALPF